MKVFATLMAIPTLAISLFLIHEILESIQADRLMWFLYWVYVPFTIFVSLALRWSGIKEE